MSPVVEKIKAYVRTAESQPLLPLLLAAVAVLISAACSLLVYPEVADSLNNKITTDRYDELGLGISHYGTLSFYPDPEPTVLRAPLYPFLLGSIFSLGEQLVPLSVQLAQALLHGLTCLLAYQTAKRLGGFRQALLVGLLCAVHPYLLWYAGRMVIETISVLLFTLIVFCVVQLAARPFPLMAACTGLAVGLGVLCKSTYLPFVFVIPLLFLLSRPRRISPAYSLVVLAVSLATISPWIIRNHNVSGQWGIVQALTGYNFYVGDRFVDQYTGSPLSYAAIIGRTDFSKMDEGLPETIKQTSGAKREVLQDAWLLSRSMNRYSADPVFLLSKIGANAIMFWTLGSTPPVSIITMLLQLPLLFLFVRSATKLVKTNGLFSPECLPVWLVAVYFAIHLPVYALARFSVVFVPTMVAFAFGYNPAARDENERSHKP